MPGSEELGVHRTRHHSGDDVALDTETTGLSPCVDPTGWR